MAFRIYRIFSVFLLFSAASPGPAWGAPPDEATAELYAGRYAAAADLFSKRVAASAQDSDAFYGLVRSLLRADRAKDAYAAAEQAARIVPQTAASLTAVALADYRRGELSKAEGEFRAALKLDSDYPGALSGLASVFSAVSRFKTARNLRLTAYKRWPDDPELRQVYANSLKGTESVAEMERILLLLDPTSERATNLRAAMAERRALGGREIGKLTSPYRKSRVKMFAMLNGIRHLRGFGVQVVLNGHQKVSLLLDTGASGISISPKAAEKAGLEHLGLDAQTVKGIGDQKAPPELFYLASALSVGDVAFSNYPIHVFRSAQSPDYDGLIGADVFDRFLVSIDFPNAVIDLEPRASGPGSDEEAQDAPPSPAPGLHRVLRFGDHIALATAMNEKKTGLFLLDSGASDNFIDSAVAQEVTGVAGDSLTTITGIQGKVNKVSRATFISLVFAGFRQDNPDLVAFDLTKLSDSMGVTMAGVLGMPVLSHLRLTVDYREGTLRLDRPR